MGLGALGGAASASATPPPPEPALLQGPQGPLQFRMDTLTADASSRTVTGSGHIVLRQDGWLMCCSALLGRTDAQWTWQEITCQGDVRLWFDHKYLTADSAVFHPDKHEVILTGKPRVQEDAHALMGARMVLDTQRQALHIDRPRGHVMPQRLTHASASRNQPAFLRGTLPQVCPLKGSTAP